MTYKDPVSLDGRLQVPAGVSAPKLAKIKSLYESAKAGSRVAAATLQEQITTSDAIFNFVHFANINFLSEYDEAPRVWSDLAGVREVPNLEDVTLFSLTRTWDNNGVLGDGDPKFVAPVIPEATPYPQAFLSGEKVEGGRVVKRGFGIEWTLEAQINDPVGLFDALPEEMRTVALDTEEADVFGALTSQASGAASQLAGGPLPDGSSVPVNAGLTRDAVYRAIIELSERSINGRKVRVNGGFNLVVPVGVKPFIEFQLGLVGATLQDGSIRYAVNDGNPLGSVTVIESEFLSGTEWYLLPKKGTTRRPVLERLELRGYRTPQLFVENVSGNYVGGSAASPFEGSFDTDSIRLKLRQFGGGVVWDGGLAVVYSNGTGVA